MITRIRLFGITVVVCLGFCMEMAPRPVVLLDQPDHTHQEQPVSSAAGNQTMSVPGASGGINANAKIAGVGGVTKLGDLTVT